VSKDLEPAALDQWYVIESSEDLRSDQPRRTRLLGRPILGERSASGTVTIEETTEEGETLRKLPCLERYGYVWTTLGVPTKPLFDMPEFEEDGRRLVVCGVLTVRTSPGRIVENFLDLSHFPFVHTDILGAEPMTEVTPYKAKLDESSGELWVTECGFYQPQAMAASSGAAQVDYLYRVPQPYAAVLYKSSPGKAGAFDLIGIFPQPLEETLCDVHCFMLVYDDVSSYEGMLQWQQGIFLQDRIILENQRPARLPLDPKAELPSRADTSAIQYRRWLKNLGVEFGVA
jgi:phenylpropionate dioxygenase-like ring-hydroxylating dioxygenase large terminal subunit